MEESVILFIAQKLGCPEDYDPYLQQISMHVDAALAELSMKGAVKDGAYTNGDSTVTFSDILAKDDYTLLGTVKDFLYSAVHLVWDPPQGNAYTQTLRDERERSGFYSLVKGEL